MLFVALVESPFVEGSFYLLLRIVWPFEGENRQNGHTFELSRSNQCVELRERVYRPRKLPPGSDHYTCQFLAFRVEDPLSACVNLH